MEDKVGFIPRIINRYKSTEDFLTGLEANAYFRGDNTEIMAKEMLKADVVKTITRDEVTGEMITRKSLNNKSVIGNRISNNFLYRFVVQQNQLLLGNGVTLGSDGLKKKLGRAFDTKLQEAGEAALLHGVSWGYWNKDHLEFISAVKDAYSGFVALCDEMTSRPMVGIQFWQIAHNKPMGVRLFEMDGVTILRYKGDDRPDGLIVDKKRPYKGKKYKDDFGEMVIDAENYPLLPVVPLYANSEKRSEFTHSIKSKIDLYDRIMSDFGDNLERANDVYWVLNNFGGTTDDVIEMIDQINKIKAVINQSNAVGGGATAEPRTIEVPYAARSAALELLKKSLYQDYMAMDMDEIRGGSLTNVAIQTATANMNLKADRFEWQCFDFVQNILILVGAPEDELESIHFTRRSVSNDSETISNIYTMRDDIPLEWALKYNPMVNPDDISDILAAKEKEKKEAEEKEQQQQQTALIAEAIKNAGKGANGDGMQEQSEADSEAGQNQQAQGRQEEGEVTPDEGEQ